MKLFSDRSTIPTEIFATILLCLATSVFAQPPQPDREAAQPKSANPSPDDDELKQGSHRSLMLTRSQSVIQCMDIVHEAFGRKDYLAAIPLMERILSEPNSFVPVDAMTEVAAHEEIRRLALQMPADLRKRLDEQRSSVAIRRWDQVRVSNKDALIAFLHQYSDLPIAVEAWWCLGLNERDHGRKRLAAAAFVKIADHPQASVIQCLTASIAAYETLQDDFPHAEADEVNNVRARIARFDPQLEIQVGSRSLRLSQWLIEHPADTVHVSQNDQSPLTDVIRSRSKRPVVLPLWKQQFNLAQNAHVIAQEQKQRELGVKPVPLTRPLVVGDRVITRNLDRICAYHLTTGVEQWFQRNTEYRDLEALGIFDRVVNQSAVIDWIQRRTQADSIFGRMSTDGVRLFVIQEPDRTREFAHDYRQASRGGGFRSGPRFNKLIAYSVIDGKPFWDIGGIFADGSSLFRGDFFLGVPFVLDDVVYVVVQRETEVLMHAIEAESGAPIWSITLGDVLLPVTEDLQRSRVACPITWNDGLLLVSTGAGAVVAVDPALRSLVWGYRYPARTISAGDLLQGNNPADIQQVQESWWDSWREPFLSLAKVPSITTKTTDHSSSDPSQTTVLIFASPETDQIHGIRLPDGAPLWREPRNGALMIAGIVEDRVIVIEGDFARAHDLETGRLIWRTPISEVSGPVSLTGGMLVLPMLSGGAMLLDARSGQLVADSSVSEMPLGSLSEVDRGWIACSRQFVMLLPRLGNVRDDVRRELEGSPDNEPLRVRAAFLDLQAGDFQSARGRLQGLKSTPARELLRQALIDALRDVGIQRSNSDRSDSARQLKDLAERPDDKFAAAMAIGSSALTVSDYPAAIEAALDGLSAGLDLTDGMIKTEAVIVRKNRALLGLIDEVYRRVKPIDRSSLDELFQKRLKDARKSKDPFAVQELALQLRGLDWGRNLVVTEEEKVLRKRSRTEIEFRLLDAAGSDDRAIARRALDRLASHFERSQANQDAWAIRKRIQAEFPSKNSDGQATGIGRAEPPQRSSPTALKRPEPIWPEVIPYTEPIEVPHFSVYSLIHLHAEPGSLADRLDIWLERNGNELLFRGDHFFQSGQGEKDERKFTLPTSTSHYRGQPGYMLREGWGIGRIVILLVGSELFAISPVDDQGEPNARWFLWSNSIELGPPPHNSKVLKGHPNVNNGFEFLVDQSNRRIGNIGPVRAGYFCYQKGNRLVAAETETGNELWERLDLPADATILGDDHRVYVWRENLLEVFSAVDGRKIEDRVWKASPANLVHQLGSLAWTVSRGQELQLELIELKTGKVVWSRRENKKSLVTALDQETLALVTPDGKLFLLDARAGHELCPPLSVGSLDHPHSLSQILTWCDLERWYVVLGPGEFPAPSKLKQGYESYRKPIVSGMLYCINRFDLKILWQRELKDEQIALDQSRVSPILVQLWKRGSQENSGSQQNVLQVTDKRTGTILNIRSIRSNTDLHPYFLLNPDPQQAIVELRLAYETIRIHYEADPPADALEAIRKAEE